jgi:hypothetical protein
MATNAAAMAISIHSDTVGIELAPRAGIGGVLEDTGPALSAVTVAVFEIVPLVAVTCVSSVIVAVAPFAIVPMLQLIGLVALQVPWDGVAETNVRPAGRVSVTTTFVAWAGPAFPTVIV